LFQDIAAPLENSRFGDLVGYALRFLSLTAVRPGEVNNAEWTEIDWDKARWAISAAKMKMDKDHVVPLSRQALDILKAVRELTGNRRYIFSCTHDQPLSNNTLNKRLRVIGYDIPPPIIAPMASEAPFRLSATRRSTETTTSCGIAMLSSRASPISMRTVSKRSTTGLVRSP